LPKIQNGGGRMDFMYYEDSLNDYLQKTKIRDKEHPFIIQHITRKNNEKDLEIYKIAIEKWENGQKLKYNELPEHLLTHKNKNGFTNRFKVVDGFGISHTIMAHISQDGNYYIFPDKNQCRSLTIREAARIQSFPDNYYFEGSRTSAFRQIGNAIPPLMAKGIAEKLK
jgi:DNA (cytosine-5)-methyltransferase 1